MFAPVRSFSHRWELFSKNGSFSYTLPSFAPVRTFSHRCELVRKIIVLRRPSRVSHRCELFRTGAKVPFCLDFAMIYAFVPRAANTKLAFRVDLPTIFRARTARDIYGASISRRPCNDLRVRTASSTIPAGTNMIYLSTPPRIRIGTKSFEPVRTCDFA